MKVFLKKRKKEVANPNFLRGKRRKKKDKNVTYPSKSTGQEDQFLSGETIPQLGGSLYYSRWEIYG